MNSSLVPSGSLKSRCDRMTLENSCTVPGTLQPSSPESQERVKYQSAFKWICLKNTIRDLCGLLPNTSFSTILLLYLIVHWNKTFGEDAKKRPCPHENKWGVSELVYDDCHVKRLNKDGFLSSCLTRATCIAFLFQRSKWGNNNSMTIHKWKCC